MTRGYRHSQLEVEVRRFTVGLAVSLFALLSAAPANAAEPISVGGGSEYLCAVGDFLGYGWCESDD